MFSTAKLVGAGVLAAALLGAWAWHQSEVRSAHARGVAEAEARCDAENLSAELAELRRQLAARDNVIASGKIRDAEREAKLQTLQDRTDGYISDIERLDSELAAAEAAPRPAGAPQVVYRNLCGGDAGRAGRLRDAWGQ